MGWQASIPLEKFKIAYSDFKQALAGDKLRDFHGTNRLTTSYP